MTEPATWAETPTAKYLAAVGYQEPAVEYRSKTQVAADWQRERGSAPSEDQLLNAMATDRIGGARVVNLGDTRSPLVSAADRVEQDGRTTIRVLNDEQVEELVAQRNAAIRAYGVTRPGRSDAAPHWSKEKSQGLMFRAISFGPSGTSFEAASEMVAEWQAQDAVEQARSDASLPRGYPR